MAKFEELPDYAQTAFDNALADHDLHTARTGIIARSVEKQKDAYKIKKFDELVESLTDNVSLVVIYDERLVRDLPVDYLDLMIRESIAGISINPDSGKIVVNKPDFYTFSPMLVLVGHEKMITFKESIKSLYDKYGDDEEKEKIDKAAKRAEKKNRKFKQD